MTDEESNKAAYDQAKQQADLFEGRVCAVRQTDEQGTPTGQPIYFVVAPDATQQEIQLAAFEARHGRPMHEVEKVLYTQAQEMGRIDV